MLQGDIAFTQKDLSTETFDGEKYITFQPNTIVYAVPANSDLADKIKAAKIGVMFHTQYTGSSFETMKASYGFDSRTLKRHQPFGLATHTFVTCLARLHLLHLKLTN